MTKDKDVTIYILASGDRSGRAKVKLPSFVFKNLELSEIREVLTEAFGTLFDNNCINIAFDFKGDL